MGALRPKRGRLATATSKNILLKEGEIFIETPDGGFGSGKGKIKIGDGETRYGDLGYFLEPGIAEPAVSGTNGQVLATDGQGGTSWIDVQSSGALKPCGTVTFANLPSISTANEGDMYNISNAFTTTSDFKEGSGHAVPAGANVYKTTDGKWDILAGLIVTGVKGNKETNYRLGNINLTPANIGAAAISEQYATCSTARNVAAKTVTLSGFKLETGARISVRFTDTGTSNPTSGNITLNVNGTGAKEIVDSHTNMTKLTYSSSLFYNNQVHDFIYDGTYWVYMNRDNNNTYSTMSTSELTTGTATTARSVRADYLKAGIDSLIDTKIGGLDVASVGGSGKYISAISETDGKISATASNMPTIPDQLSDLTDDASHRLVTDTEKSTWNSKQNALTFDNTPTQNSNNPVKSGGVFSALAVPKIDTTTGVMYLEGGAAFSGNIDSTPTAGSNNAVSSGGVYTALNGKVSKGSVLLSFSVTVGNITVPTGSSVITLTIPTSAKFDGLAYNILFFAKGVPNVYFQWTPDNVTTYLNAQGTWKVSANNMSGGSKTVYLQAVILWYE